jgi:hypothetical protein
MKTKALIQTLWAALLLPALANGQVAKETAQEEARVFDQYEYGKPNPKAPPELSQFAFLIGKWRCESKVKGQDGEYQTYPAIWIGRYILDGYVIADEFRQFGPNGELTQLGQTYRSYNSEKNIWIMKWHDALASTWLNLGPEDLGGVQVSDESITFKHHVPPGPVGQLFPPHAVFRMTISDISENHFIWRAEVSTDREKSWDQVHVIEAYRAED